jgi:hypothetical protein
MAPLAAQATLSQAHLAQQANELASALADLDQARQRIRSQADPHQAGDAIDAGYEQIRQAAAANGTIAQDLRQLNERALSFQHQIDVHRNDLLGPRGRRIRDGLIIIAVLVAVGAALLQLGPLFGGPIGGVVIIAGHLLTAFIVPLLSGLRWLLEQAWERVVPTIRSVIAWLKRLGSAKSTTVGKQTSGAIPPNATTASH